MKRATGFTLLELLIAIAVLAVIGAASFAGLRQALVARERVAAEAERLAEVQRAVDLLAQDLAQLALRPVRDAVGREEPALVGGEGRRPLLVFTRAGWPNPGELPRSGLHRLAWDFDRGTLWRADWRALDRADAAEPERVELLGTVRGLKLRFLDAEGRWQPLWPPRGADAPRLPRAVEFTLELEDWGTIARLVPVAGP